MSNTENDSNQAAQNSSEPRTQVETRPLSHSLFVGLAIAALLLTVVIYSGIHQRAVSASDLGAATERAAIAAHASTTIPTTFQVSVIRSSASPRRRS